MVEMFVGRERELAALVSRLQDAEATGPGVIFITGEAGVGKTRLLREVAAKAEVQGWRVLFGHAYDTEGMPPFLAFAEAIGQHLRSSAGEEAARALAEAAPEVALLVPELRALTGNVAGPSSLGPEADRYRLFEAVSEFFLGLSCAGDTLGLLLCLEDLHWADKPTLLLLQHLARRLAGSRLRLMATYRDAELGLDHPLSAVLAGLSREHLYEQTAVDVLREDEASRLIQAIAGTSVDPAVTAEIYRLTGGNAFFLEEVVRHLVGEGHDLARPETAVSAWSIPEGVRQVIRGRVARLGREAGALLQAASAMDSGAFDLPLLSRVTGFEPEIFAEALEEALRAGLLRQKDGCDFSHALVRETIYSGISLHRRQALHLRTAEASEALHGVDVESRLAALATQYRLAGDLADRGKAIDYSVRAAEASSAVYAWEEAVSHYERALEALEVSGRRDDAQQCDLLLGLGRALVASGSRDRVWNEIAPRALALAEALGDHARAFAACQLVLETTSGVPNEWLQAAETHVADDPQARIRLYRVKTTTALHRGRFREARLLASEALDLARGVGDHASELRIASIIMRVGLLPPEEERALLHKTLQVSRQTMSAQDLVDLSFDIAMAHLQWGDRTKAEAERRLVAELMARTRDSHAVVMSSALESMFAALDGRLPEAVASARASRAGSFTPVWLGRLANWLGDNSSLEAELRWSDRLTSSKRDLSYRAFFLAQLGRLAEAQDVLREVPDLAAEPPHHPNYGYAVMDLEVAAVSHDRSSAPALLDLVDGDDRYLASPHMVLVPRQRAALARLLGDHGRARRELLEAIDFCERISYRPELALSRLDLAELLLAHFPGERAAAFEHLEAAIGELEAMEMRPALGRALQLRGRRRPTDSKAPAYPDGLSEREVEVLRLLATGKSNQQIADDLVISYNTVVRHVTHIFSKTSAANRVEAVRYGRRVGLLQD